MAREWFFALLNPSVAHGGWGAYDRKTGRCLFYSEGARAGTEWFFEMKSGKPVFYLRDGRLHWMPRPKS